MSEQKYAIKIKTINERQVLWEVFPRIEGNKFVITSASNVPYSGPETYIFASDSEGKILDWSELPGSFRGSLEHKKCLENIGYQVNE